MSVYLFFCRNTVSCIVLELDRQDREQSGTYKLPKVYKQKADTRITSVHMNTGWNQGCGVKVGVSHLKETSTPGPICFIWTFV